MKTNILLLHGALSDERQFDALKPLLSDKFEVHTMSFEGHGNRQGKDRPFRNAYFIENIDEYLKQNSIDKATLFGYSMGGYAALLYAAQYPDKVEKVFTLATKIIWNKEIAERETAMLNPEIMMQKIPVFAESLKQKHIAFGWKRVLHETSLLLNDLGEYNYLNADLFLSLKCPWRMALGDKDRTVSLEECIWAKGLVKDAEVEIFEDTPHPFEKVKPETIAEWLLAN